MPLGKGKKAVVKIPKRKKGKPELRKGFNADVAHDIEERFEEPMLDAEAIIGKGMDTLHRLGLKLPKRPIDSDGEVLEAEFPPDLSKCTDEELGRLLGVFRGWANYALGQLALLDTRYTAATMNEKTARVIEQLQGTGSIKDREAKALIAHRTYVKSETYAQRRAEQKLLQAVYEGFINDHKTISREISRREKLYEGRGED